MTTTPEIAEATIGDLCNKREYRIVEVITSTNDNQSVGTTQGQFLMEQRRNNHIKYCFGGHGEEGRPWSVVA